MHLFLFLYLTLEVCSWWYHEDVVTWDNIFTNYLYYWMPLQSFRITSLFH